MPNVMLSVAAVTRKQELTTPFDCEKYLKAIENEVFNGTQSSSGVPMPVMNIKQLSNTVTLEHLQNLLSKADPKGGAEIAEKEKLKLEKIRKCREVVDDIEEQMDVVTTVPYCIRPQGLKQFVRQFIKKIVDSRFRLPLGREQKKHLNFWNMKLFFIFFYRKKFRIYFFL